MKCFQQYFNGSFGHCDQPASIFLDGLHKYLASRRQASKKQDEDDSEDGNANGDRTRPPEGVAECK